MVSVDAATAGQQDRVGYNVSSAVESIITRLEVTPSPLQHDVLMEDRRILLVTGGERAGKSWVSGLFGTTRTLFGKLFWIVGADYELARPEFYYWSDNLLKLGAIKSQRDISIPKQGSCSLVTKSGQRVVTKTADDVKKLAAVAPDGIIMAEAAQMSYDVFLKCQGRLSEKRGWLLMSGTLEGSLGWYPELWSEMQMSSNLFGGVSYSLPTWSNLIIFPGGRQDPEILRMEKSYSRVPGLFEERCGAVPTPPHTLIFRDFRHTVHVRDDIAVFNENKPVFLAIDPSSGGDPYSVLACQFHDVGYDDKDNPDPIDICTVIDEYYERDMLAEDIIPILKKRSWWKNVRGGAIDVEAPDEKKRWSRLGGVRLVSNKIPQKEGIRRLKSFLSYKRDDEGMISVPPHLYLSRKVKSLPAEVMHYKRKEEDLEGVFGAVRDEPPKNQEDHSIKALWYLLIARYGYVKAQRHTGRANRWKRKRL